MFSSIGVDLLILISLWIGLGKKVSTVTKDTMSSDLYTSVAVGVIATLVAINMPQLNLFNGTVKVDNDEISEEVVATLEKSPHLKKFFGVPDAQLSKDQKVDDTNSKTAQNESENAVEKEVIEEEAATPKRGAVQKPPSLKAAIQGIADEDLDEDEFLTICVGWILTIGMCLAFLFAINLASKGEVGRVIAGMFPVETTALGIKQMLEKL